MGGIGSGRRQRLSDAEKRAKGTTDHRYTEAAVAERAVAKIVAGPWLPAVPPPGLPLKGVALQKYNEIAGRLLDLKRLTTSTQMRAEQAAIMYHQQYDTLMAGKPVTAAMSKHLDKLLYELGIAENAPVVGNQGQAAPKKFAHVGFANRRPQKG